MRSFERTDQERKGSPDWLYWAVQAAIQLTVTKRDLLLLLVMYASNSRHLREPAVQVISWEESVQTGWQNTTHELTADEVKKLDLAQIHKCIIATWSEIPRDLIRKASRNAAHIFDDILSLRDTEYFQIWDVDSWNVNNITKKIFKSEMFSSFKFLIYLILLYLGLNKYIKITKTP